MPQPAACTFDDRAELQDLAARYAFALDMRQWDELRSIFTADGHIDYSNSQVVRDGIDAIVAFFSTEAAIPAATLHLMHTTLQWATSEDTAEGRIHVTAHHIAHGAPQPAPPTHDYVVACTYTDQYVRTPEGWRISKRRCTTLTHVGDPAVLGR